MTRRFLVLTVAALALAACGGSSDRAPADTDVPTDSGFTDDASQLASGPLGDASMADSGSGAGDASMGDAGMGDGGMADGGTDSGMMPMSMACNCCISISFFQGSKRQKSSGSSGG